MHQVRSYPHCFGNTCPFARLNAVLTSVPPAQRGAKCQDLGGGHRGCHEGVGGHQGRSPCCAIERKWRHRASAATSFAVTKRLLRVAYATVVYADSGTLERAPQRMSYVEQRRVAITMTTKITLKKKKNDICRTTSVVQCDW